MKTELECRTQLEKLRFREKDLLQQQGKLMDRSGPHFKMLATDLVQTQGYIAGIKFALND